MLLLCKSYAQSAFEKCRTGKKGRKKSIFFKMDSDEDSNRLLK